jgi:hypothetical protein
VISSLIAQIQSVLKFPSILHCWRISEKCEINTVATLYNILYSGTQMTGKLLSTLLVAPAKGTFFRTDQAAIFLNLASSFPLSHLGKWAGPPLGDVLFFPGPMWRAQEFRSAWNMSVKTEGAHHCHCCFFPSCSGCVCCVCSHHYWYFCFPLNSCVLFLFFQCSAHEMSFKKFNLLFLEVIFLTATTPHLPVFGLQNLWLLFLMCMTLDSKELPYVCCNGHFIVRSLESTRKWFSERYFK